jgi:hypothetical protein
MCARLERRSRYSARAPARAQAPEGRSGAARWRFPPAAAMPREGRGYTGGGKPPPFRGYAFAS